MQAQVAAASMPSNDRDGVADDACGAETETDDDEADSPPPLTVEELRAARLRAFAETCD